MTVLEKLNQRIDAANSMVCVGLDSNIDRIPERFYSEPHPQFAFNRWIIEQTHEYVCAYKPNMAFYEARGADGWLELQMTMDYLHTNHPDIFTICDAKRGDIGSTNTGYV
ncbi:MAG: orotidine 5'-phosphate decarboxylase / HUMPS family protein, partial [Chloroflexota bacterium]